MPNTVPTISSIPRKQFSPTLRGWELDLALERRSAPVAWQWEEGCLPGGLATGGTLLVAAGAAAATAYAIKKVDGALYGSEDARFAANLSKKQHMIGLSERYHNRLAGPAAGKVDLNNIYTLN